MSQEKKNLLPKTIDDSKSTDNNDLFGFNDVFPISMGISLGKSKEKEIFQFNKDRYCHTVVLGRTGSGKSNLLHQMIREDVLAGAGVAIFAHHLEDAIYPLSCIPESRIKDVVIIDATDEYCPCLNPLGVDYNNSKEKNIAIEKTIDLLKSQCRYDFAGPRFDSYCRMSLSLMMEAASFQDPYISLLEDFLTDPEVVKKALKYCTNEKVYNFWTKVYPAIQRSNEAGDVVEWALSKVHPFSVEQTLISMFGPGKKTINFQEIVDNNKILVVFAPANYIGTTASHFIKTLILMELNDAIMARGGKHTSTGLIRNHTQEKEEISPFFVYIDEFGEFVDDKFIALLSQARKRNVGFVLSFQNLDQLNVFNPKTSTQTNQLMQSVLANVGTFISYSMGVKDAHLLSERYSVHSSKLLNIERYKPKALIRMNAIDYGPITLDIPLKPDVLDENIPSKIMNNLIKNKILLPRKELPRAK